MVTDVVKIQVVTERRSFFFTRTTKQVEGKCRFFSCIFMKSDRNQSRRLEIFSLSGGRNPVFLLNRRCGTDENKR